MKKIFRYSMGVLFAGLAITACSPDEFEGANGNLLPSTDGVNVTWDIDDETNTVSAKVDVAPGTYPMWYIHWPDKNDTTGLKPNTLYSTLSDFSRQFVEAGTYTLELRIANRNGFSDGRIKKEVTFEKTAVDWSAITKRLVGKEWRISKDEKAHLGCGERYTDGTNWWTAGPGEKKDNGVYDDRITFNEDGTYTYNPGDDGLVFVNKDVTALGGAASDADRDEPVQAQTSHYSFKSDFFTPRGSEEEQQVNYLVLDDNTLFPYISSDQQYQKPVFRIESYSNTKLVLVYDNPDVDISWHYILTSQEAVPEFEGFKVDSDFNLFKNANIEMGYYYAPNWSQLPNPEVTQTGYTYNFTLPEATFDRWQAQIVFNTDIAVNAATNYDFSVILNASKDVKAMVKLTQRDNDDNFFFADEVDLKAGQEYIFWRSDMPGIDAPQLKLVLDFGGNQDGTDVEVRNIVLKDHANDDGTVLPDDNGNGGEEGGGDDTPSVNWVAVDSPDNLGAGFNTKGEMSFWWADAGWGQVSDPGFSYANGVYTVTAVANGGSEWQGQCTINGVPLKIEKGQGYDVRVKVVASDDLGRFTVKVNKDPDVQNDPNTLCYRGDFSLKEGENYLTFVNVVAKNGDEEIEFDQGKLIFDFGGAPEGFEAKISDIIIQKHVVDDTDPKSVDWCDYTSDDNLGAGFNTVGSMSFWWADAGWGQVGDPGFSYANGVYTVTAVANGGSEWQAQCTINGAPLKIEKGQMYDVSVTIVASEDLGRCTVKVNKDPDVQNDPNTLCYRGDFKLKEGENVLQFAGVVAKNGDEEIAFDQGKMIFDFGGAPEGFEAKISKIIVQKHKTK